MSPSVNTYNPQPTTLTIGLMTALTMPKMIATSRTVPMVPHVEAALTLMPGMMRVAIQTANAEQTSLRTMPNMAPMVAQLVGFAKSPAPRSVGHALESRPG